MFFCSLLVILTKKILYVQPEHHNTFFEKKNANTTNILPIEQYYYDGECGKNIKYSLIDDKMYLNGYGKMYDYTKIYEDNDISSTSPFNKKYYNVNYLWFSDFITSVGDWSFYNLSKLETVILPDTLEQIGEGSFSKCCSLKSITIN